MRHISCCIALIDGREELIEEVAQAPDDVRTYIAKRRLRSRASKSSQEDGVICCWVLPAG